MSRTKVDFYSPLHGMLDHCRAALSRNHLYTWVKRDCEHLHLPYIGFCWKLKSTNRCNVAHASRESLFTSLWVGYLSLAAHSPAWPNSLPVPSGNYTFTEISIIFSRRSNLIFCFFILQYYDLYKTEELPTLEGSNFSPKVKSFAINFL